MKLIKTSASRSAIKILAENTISQFNVAPHSDYPNVTVGLTSDDGKEGFKLVLTQDEALELAKRLTHYVQSIRK